VLLYVVSLAAPKLGDVLATSLRGYAGDVRPPQALNSLMQVRRFAPPCASTPSRRPPPRATRTQAAMRRTHSCCLGSWCGDAPCSDASFARANPFLVRSFARAPTGASERRRLVGFISTQAPMHSSGVTRGVYQHASAHAQQRRHSWRGGEREWCGVRCKSCES
jgi:hypothetical protein